MGEKLIRMGVGFEASKLIGQYEPKAREIFYSAMDELGKIGADTMRSKLKKTSSRSSRSGLKALLGFSDKGRIRTGKMYESIGYRPRGKGKLYQVEVGYIKGFQEYFNYQETGFTNVWKFLGQWNRPYSNAPNAPAGWEFERVRSGAPRVKGVFAMKDARDAMDKAIDGIMKKAGRKMDKI